MVIAILCLSFSGGCRVGRVTSKGWTSRFVPCRCEIDTQNMPQQYHNIQIPHAARPYQLSWISTKSSYLCYYAVIEADDSFMNQNIVADMWHWKFLTAAPSSGFTRPQKSPVAVGEYILDSKSKQVTKYFPNDCLTCRYPGPPGVF